MANTAVSTHGPARPSRLRTALAAILIGLAVIIAPLGIIGHWVATDLNDTDHFVAALAPLASDPAIQDVLVTALVTEVESQIDLEALVASSLEESNLPNLAQGALEILVGQATERLRAELEQAANGLVTSQTFANIWAKTLAVTHDQLISALKDDGSGSLVIGDSGDIGISLNPLIEPLRERLATTGSGLLANLLPTVDVVIPVAQSDQVAALAKWYSPVVTAGLWAPWVALGLFLAGIFVANRRLRALGIGALSLAAMSGLLYLGFGWGKSAFADVLTKSSVFTEGACDSIYGALLGPVITMTLTIGLTALAVGIVALGTYLLRPKPMQTVRGLSFQ